MKLANDELGHGSPDLLPGHLVEPVVDAPVNAAQRLLLGSLPEAIEVVRDVREPARLSPRRRDRNVVGAERQLQGARCAGANRRQVAGVRRIRRRRDQGQPRRDRARLRG